MSNQLTALYKTINNPQDFKMAAVVSKQSKSGITSNKRLLVIKGGHLFYYSNVPKEFNYQIQSIQYFHELPKSSIQIMKISQIRSYESVQCLLAIVFDSTFMMEREDIRKTLTAGIQFVPKKKKQQTIWLFSFDSVIIKNQWLSALNSLKQHFLKQQSMIKSYFEQINGEKEKSKQRQSPSKFGKRPWRQSVFNKQMLQLDNSISQKINFN